MKTKRNSYKCCFCGSRKVKKYGPNEFECRDCGASGDRACFSPRHPDYYYSGDKK